MYNRVTFGPFTMLCNHHHCTFPELFHHPRQKISKLVPTETKKRRKNIEKNIRDIWDLEKISNICVTELPKGEENK